MTSLGNRYWIAGLAVLSALLLSMNIALLLINTKLQRVEWDHLRTYEVKAGTVLSGPLSGLDPTKHHIQVQYGPGQPPTLIFVMSPECGMCDENWPNWKTLHRELARAPIRIIGFDISQQMQQQYLTNHGAEDIPVISRYDPIVLVQYNLYLTPQTILVNGNGLVEKVWTGELTHTTMAEIERRVMESVGPLARPQGGM